MASRKRRRGSQLADDDSTSGDLRRQQAQASRADGPVDAEVALVERDDVADAPNSRPETASPSLSRQLLERDEVRIGQREQTPQFGLDLPGIYRSA